MANSCQMMTTKTLSKLERAVLSYQHAYLDLWPLGLRVSACLATAMQWCLPGLMLIARAVLLYSADRQTDRQSHRRHWSPYPHRCGQWQKDNKNDYNKHFNPLQLKRWRSWWRLYCEVFIVFSVTRGLQVIALLGVVQRCCFGLDWAGFNVPPNTL